MYDRTEPQQLFPICKPRHSDHISIKEKFIHAKYSEKLFVCKPKEHHLLSVANNIWTSVHKNDKKAVYRCIVTSEADPNAVHRQASISSSLSLAKVMMLHEKPNLSHQSSTQPGDSLGKSLEASSLNPASRSIDQDGEDFLDGCSLLHLACQTADIGMLELLLQYGASINAPDSRGRTPLHHCILRGRTVLAKLLLSRGADPQAVDMDGKTPLMVASDSVLKDDEILSLLAIKRR